MFNIIFVIIVLVLNLLLNFIFTKLSIKKAITSFVSSFFYLLPLWLLPKSLKVDKNFMIFFYYKRWQHYINSINIIKFFIEYKSIIFSIILYVIIIGTSFGGSKAPSYYKNLMSYEVKYNFLHALLLMIIETPLIILYKTLIKELRLNSYLKPYIKIFLISILLVNHLLIIYCIIHAINNVHVIIPIATESCQMHLKNDTP